MNILLIHATWKKTGGDWTYIQSIKKIYEEHGHNVIPFSTNHEDNLPSANDANFIQTVDYRSLSKQFSIGDINQVFRGTFYNREAILKLRKTIKDHKIDVAQLHNIHNIFSLSILKELKKHNIFIAWRALDYKLLCPNRTFLVDSSQSICTKCIEGSFWNCASQKCKKDSFFASLVASLEAIYISRRNLLNYVDCFILQNNFSYKLFVKAGFNKNKLSILKNPYVSNITNNISTKKTKNQFIFFGRLSSEKGLLPFLHFLKKIQTCSSFLIIGNGPQENELKSYVAEQGLEKVFFLGPKWGQELNQILSESMFSVVPSIWHEPSPYSILQSFENNLPVLGSNLGGIPELVEDGKTGYIYDPLSFSSFKHKFLKIHSDFKTMQSNCGPYLEREHNPEHYYLSSIELFKVSS